MKLSFPFDNRASSEDQELTENQSLETLDGGLEDQGGEDYIPGLSDLYFPEDDFEVAQQQQDECAEKIDVPKDLFDVLFEMGAINQQQLSHCRNIVSQSPQSEPEQILLNTGFIEPGSDNIYRAKASLSELEFMNVDPFGIQENVFRKLDVDFIKSNQILPVELQEDKLKVATSKPENVFIFEEVKQKTGLDVIIAVCSPDDISKAVEYFSEDKLEYDLDDIINDMTDVEVVQDEESDYEDLEEMAGQSPVIKFVNYLISNAITQGASDIHIEPKEKITKVRFRIDGILFDTTKCPIKMHPAVVSRIKIMSNLDISERRVPQDGKITVIVGGRAIDLRVSTLPISTGEKVVIRVLDSSSVVRGLEHLGMEDNTRDKFNEMIHMPHGIILVTGPTGSGKSTTLYSALCEMDGDTLNVSTVEDPVEYDLDFCNQVQANEKVGLTFSAALRSLLRQDPDIIMIGEIRDLETAKIAVQSALTGHLVLSTLHTNDAPSSVTRLVNIGIDQYLIAASLNGILAQRLVRKICPNCKENYQVSDHLRCHFENAGIDLGQVVHGVGCEKCRNSGYLGRLGIYELLIVDDNFRDIINTDASVTNLRRAFWQSDSHTLFNDGLEKVRKGLTTIDEVLRVTEVNSKNNNQNS